MNSKSNAKTLRKWTEMLLRAFSASVTSFLVSQPASSRNKRQNNTEQAVRRQRRGQRPKKNEFIYYTLFYKNIVFLAEAEYYFCADFRLKIWICLYCSIWHFCFRMYLVSGWCLGNVKASLQEFKPEMTNTTCRISVQQSASVVFVAFWLVLLFEEKKKSCTVTQSKFFYLKFGKFLPRWYFYKIYIEECNEYISRLSSL